MLELKEQKRHLRDLTFGSRGQSDLEKRNGLLKQEMFFISPQSRAPCSILKWRRTCGRMCPISWRAEWQQNGGVIVAREYDNASLGDDNEGNCMFMSGVFYTATHQKKLQEGILAYRKTNPLLAEPNPTEPSYRKVEMNLFFFFDRYLYIDVDTRTALLFSTNKEGHNDALSTNWIEREK